MRETKRKKGTLFTWAGERGGNGQLTKPQVLLASYLNWPTEVSITTGMGKLRGYPPSYKVDIGNEGLKIAIEIDGKGHNLPLQKAKDMKKESLLRTLGWKVLRFTNKEVTKNPMKVYLEIKREERKVLNVLT